jgi:AraC family transcriptional activator of pobA
MNNTGNIIDYSEIFSRSPHHEIIDLEEKLKTKFHHQIFDLKEALPLINYTIPPIKDDRYHIVLVKKGTGEKKVGIHRFPIKDNMLAIIPRKVVYSGKYNTTDNEGYVLFFSQEFFINNAFPPKHLSERCILRSSFNPFIILSDHQVMELSKIFEVILKEQGEGNRSKKEMICLKILELLIMCDRYFIEAKNAFEPEKPHNLYERLNLFIDRNFDKSRKVDFYAKLLHIHPNHLNFVVKKNHNITVKQLIDKRIVMESKYLLSHTDFSVKEISYRLGFDDQNYFSFFFKKHTGLTTQEYRTPI